MKNADILSLMGHTAMGTRLKRAGQMMQATAQKWLEAQGCDLPSAQMPVIAALNFHGARTTGELAETLGIAQPGVSRLIAGMEKAGWVRSKADEADKRIRLITLSDAGADLAAKAERDYWPVIGRAVEQITTGLEGGFLAQLETLELRLSAGALDQALKEETLS